MLKVKAQVVFTFFFSVFKTKKDPEKFTNELAAYMYCIAKTVLRKW